MKATTDRPSLRLLFWARVSFLLAGLATLGLALAGPHLLLRPFCHQMPSRTPQLGGAPIGLCFRCLGLLLGGLLGTLASFAFPTLERHLGRRLLLAGVLPLLLDVGLQTLGLYQSNLIRLLTGLAAGGLAARALLSSAQGPPPEGTPCSML
jgi:uncharacterized membrane protein